MTLRSTQARSLHSSRSSPDDRSAGHGDTPRRQGARVALADHPELNTRLVRGRFIPRESVDIFFIVSTEGGRDLSGVKVVNADRKHVVDIAAELASRAARVRTGHDAELGKSKSLLDATPTWLLGPVLRLGTWLTADRNIDLKRFGLPRQAFGSAMVSSVGTFGVHHAYGPLSPLYRVPFLALVGEITQKPAVVDGEIVARPMLTVSADDGPPVPRRLARGTAGEERARLSRGPRSIRAAAGDIGRARRAERARPMSATRPWLKHYGDVPPTLDYPQVAMVDAVMATARRLPEAIAYDFLGTTATYRELGEAIDRCADAFAALGLGRGDRITISMPTSPQGVIAFYAAGKLGAVASLIHPLSTASEIEEYLNQSRSRFALTLDAFYERFAEVRPRTSLETLVLARITDGLPALKQLGFRLTRGRKIPRVPADADVHWWSQLMAEEHPAAPPARVDTHDLAAILFSGGTTGSPEGDHAVAPELHQRGDGARRVGRPERVRHRSSRCCRSSTASDWACCVHAPFMSGAKAVMVPVFSAEVVAKLIRTKRPTSDGRRADALRYASRDPSLRRADLSCLRAAFSGADTLPRPVKERFERLVAEAAAREAARGLRADRGGHRDHRHAAPRVP